MSAEALNIMNIAPQGKEKPSLSAVPQNNGKDGDAFSKLLDKAESGYKNTHAHNKQVSNNQTSVEKSSSNEHNHVKPKTSEIPKSTDESTVAKSESHDIKSDDIETNITEEETSVKPDDTGTDTGTENEENTGSLTDDTQDTAEDSASEGNSNSLVSESILANVDFTGIAGTNTDNAQTVNTLLSNASQTTNAVSTSETPVSTVNTVTSTDIDVDIDVNESNLNNSKNNNTAKTQIENNQQIAGRANTANTQTTDIKTQTTTTDSAQAIADSNVDDTAAQIKASEKVAAAAKETAVVQSQEISSKAKDTALAKLQGLENTDTAVIQSSVANDTQGNNSFSQGSASEQIIKMTVENVQGEVQSGPVDFSAHLNNSSKQIQTAPAMNTQAPKDFNKADVMNQINAQMTELPKDGSKVTIILKPENLGRIHLEIINSHEGIVAKMSTENQHVKELLDKSMEALKSQLSSQGVNVNNIKVEYSQQTANNAMDFEREQFNQNFSKHTNDQHKSDTQDGQSYSDDIAYEENKEGEAENSVLIHNGIVDYKV